MLEEFIVKDGDSYSISDHGWNYIRELSKTVVYRYFKYYDVEDLISISTLDLAWFILNVLVGSDDVPRNLRNVLFTRSRNKCTNFINHAIKSEPTDDDILSQYPSELTAEDYDTDLDYKFSTRAEAHLLSMKIWELYNGR